ILTNYNEPLVQPNLALPGARAGEPKELALRGFGARIHSSGSGHFQALARQLTSSAGLRHVVSTQLRGHSRLRPTTKSAVDSPFWRRGYLPCRLPRVLVVVAHPVQADLCVLPR